MRPGIPTQLAMLRSILAGLEGDSATAIAQARLAGELVPAGAPAQASANLRGTATVLLALAHVRAGDLEAAAGAYEAGLPDLRAGGNVMALGRAIADLAGIAIARGDPAGALRLCESELARHDGGTSAAETASVWAAIAKARAELGQAELADAAARRALELANRAGDVPSARSAQATLARVAPLLAGATGPSSSSLQTGAGGTVEALTETICLDLPVSAVMKAAEGNGRLFMYICGRLGTKLATRMAVTSVNLRYPVENRFASFLLAAIDGKGQVIGTDDLGEIADFLGASYRQLGRVVRRFRDEGIIDKGRGRIRVLDRKKLTPLAKELSV